MLKQGRSKVPLSRVGLVAKALGVGPLHMFSIVMSEYEPDTGSVLKEAVFKQPLVTANEMSIIEVVRQAKVQNPYIRTEEERIMVLDVINQLKPDGTD